LQEERYLPAEVLTTFRAGEATTVRTEDGEVGICNLLNAILLKLHQDHALTEAQSKEVIECNPEALDSKIDDLINISDLNEMSILHNLRIRYKEDRIYTSVSSILISVNPFKLLPLYTPEILDLYRTGSRDKPPHVFGVAYNAYASMLADSGDQSVVISGESGAGKSEATKLILQVCVYYLESHALITTTTPLSLLRSSLRMCPLANQARRKSLERAPPTSSSRSWQPTLSWRPSETPRP
jgi:hypothetical protein